MELNWSFYYCIENKMNWNKPSWRDYRLICYASRWLDADFDCPTCEVCRYIYLKKIKVDDKYKISMQRAIEVHHLKSRWWKNNVDNRMYDPMNLIFICRFHHQNCWYFDDIIKKAVSLFCKYPQCK